MADYAPLGADRTTALFDGSGRPLNFAVCPTCQLTRTFKSGWGSGSKTVQFEGDCGHKFEVPVPK